MTPNPVDPEAGTKPDADRGSGSTEDTKPNRWTRLPSRAVFDGCVALAHRKSMDEIAAAISASLDKPVHRTQVNRVIAEAVRRGYLQLTAPADKTLADRIRDRFNNPRAAENSSKPKIVKVVEQSYEISLEHVAAVAAETAMEVVREHYERKNPRDVNGLPRTAKPEPVHIGFGAGSTMTMVARYLADRVRAEVDPPQLHIHSLTAGFRVEDPQTSPNSFCNFYREVPGMSYTGLFVPPYAVDLAWQQTRKEGPGIQESFKQRSEIDIVITSLASVNDDHGELNRFMKMYAELTNETGAKLEEAARVGDVMYRPYNDTRPIRFDKEMRAATLFELDELVEFAHRDDTAVILVAGPCGSPTCRRHRGAALFPLLEAPALDVWTHLVTDDITGRYCVQMR
jgi:DNA-binding transcriptional regulator LsrR (DeoR family)